MSNALPEKFMAWHSRSTLDHTGTWATTRYPDEAQEYVKVAALPGLVEPLEWVDQTKHGWCEKHIAGRRGERRYYLITRQNSIGERQYSMENSFVSGSPQKFDTLEAAKAAAQAHYTAQIMAAFGVEGADHK